MITKKKPDKANPLESRILLIISLFTFGISRTQAQAYNTGNMYISGNIYLNGAFTNETSASYLNNGTYYISGDFTNNQSSIVAGTSTSSGTIIFNGTLLQNINGTASSNFYNATVVNTADVKMSKDIFVAGVFTPQTGNLQLNGNTLNLSGTIDNTVTNTGTITADATASGTSALNITGTGDLAGNLKFTSGSQVLKNFTLDRTSGIATLGSDLSVGGTTSTTNNGIAAMTKGALVINGHTLNLNGTLTGTGNGTFTGSGTSNLSIGGDLSSQLGIVYFTSGNETLNTISINRSSGTNIGNAVLGTALTVNGLTLTKGVIATGNNLLTWNKTGALTAPNTPWVAHTTNYNNSFVATCDASGTPITPSVPFDGSKGFRINNVGGSTDVYFPVGSSFLSAGSGLSPAPNRMMLNNEGTSDNFTVVVGTGDVGNTAGKIVQRIWYVKAQNGTGIKANMRLFYTMRTTTNYPVAQNEVESAFSYIDGRVLQSTYTGAVPNYSNVSADIPLFGGGYTTDIDELYAQYTVGNSTDNAGAKNGITSFSRFTITNQTYIILPVTILDIKASKGNNKVTVDWSTGSEVNIARYEVEQSADGINFKTIGSVKALNNGQLKTDYAFTDNLPLQGNNYYRIRAIDNSAKNIYSKIVKINIGNNKNDITVYPNPVRGTTTNLQFSNIPAGKYSIRLISNDGRLIWEKYVNHETGIDTYTVQLGGNLAKGLYHLLIQDPNNRFDKKLVIE